MEGYGNIMPVSTRPPAKLAYEEVVAVINYLQSLDGTPAVKVGAVRRPPRETAVGVAVAREGSRREAAVADPVAMLTTFECLACHSLKPGEVIVGPPFDAALLRQAAAERGVSAEAYVMESIVNPRVLQQEDFAADVMPEDYGERLTAGQLQSMVTYLLSREGEE